MVQQNSFFGGFVDPFVLEETDLGRQSLFQSFLPTQANPSQARQFQGLFQPTFNQFLGQLGAQVRQGTAPDLTFTQFLEEQFNPQRALLRQPNAQGVNAGGPTLFRFNN